MEKEFIPYELALIMQQLGFNEPCLASWSYTYELQNHVELKLGYIIDGPNNYTNAPSFQQAFRWFREKYNLYAWAKYEFEDDKITPTYYIISPEYTDIPGGPYNTYEEAELACLEKLIEIVEQSKSE